MKRIAFISTLAFLTVGASLWVSQSFVMNWEPLLRSRLEQQLGRAIHGRVHIENITVSFIHRIALGDVEVWDTQSLPETLVFRAKTVSLTLSLIDLPRALYHRNPLESVGLISVDTPLLVLSPEILSRQNTRPASSSKPLWFTVEWDHGTFQWKDAQAPHGVWSLYQSRGIFRIRGPHMDVSTQGALEQVESVNVRVSSLGHGWNAQGHLLRGDIHSVLTLIEHFTHHPVLPEGWKTDGHFNLDIKAGGRWPLDINVKTSSLLEEAKLSLVDTQLETGDSMPAVQLNGGLIVRKSRADFTALTAKIEKTTFKITGHIWPFSKTPQIDLQATSSQTDLALLPKFLGSGPDNVPWLRGNGALDISMKGSVAHPDILFQVNVPQGEISRWPFQNASVQIHRAGNQWEINPSTVHVWEGNLALKGTWSNDQVNIQLTGDDMSLQSINPTRSNEFLKGRLNFSLSTHGSIGNLHTVGSYWINNLSWGRSYTESLRGDLDITPAHFELQGDSEDTPFHIQAEGLRNVKAITLQQFQIQLPSGASLTAEGSFLLPSQRLRVSLDAENIALPDDLPFIASRSMHWKGTAELHGRLEGTIPNLVLKAEVQSHHLQIGDQPILQASASLRWTPQEFDVETFQVEPGYSGSLHKALNNLHQWELKLNLAKAPIGLVASMLGKEQAFTGVLSGKLAIKDSQGLSGEGDVTLADATVGSLAIPQGILQFKLQERTLDIQRLSMTTAQGKADFKGRASWDQPRVSHAVGKVFFHGEGLLASLNGGSLWNMPCHLRGRLDPEDAWKGELVFDAPAIKVRGAIGDPFSFHLTWDSTALNWDQLRWGNALTGNGSLQFTGEHPQWSGQLKAHDANLLLWQAWFLPQTKEPVHGALSGLFTLSGGLQDPVLHFAGKIHQGHWRTFHFENDFEGAWKTTGLDPLILNGTLLSGGQFHFLGRISNINQTASGSLDLAQIDLKPLGETLSFPNPLEGKGSGTFTVNGPLTALHLAGHVEMASLVYGKPNSDPLKLQSYVMDLKLDPVADQPTVTRLTISQAIAKTQEEEIRLSPGSYVEFAGNQASSMKIGTEIRNLHLGVFTLFGGLDVAGTWQIKPEGFALQGDVYTRSLFINDYQLEQGHVDANYYNRVLTFKPPRQAPALLTGTIDFQDAHQLKFKDFAIVGKEHQGLRLLGDIGPNLWNFAMEGLGLDISTLSGLAGFPYSLQGTADVKIRGTGDLAHPQVDGTVQIQDGEAVGLHFKSGSAAFIWQGQHMTFTRLLLSDPGRYTLTGGGVFPLTAKAKTTVQDKTLDFSVRLVDSNLGLLQSLSREVKQAKGSVQAILQIKGTTDAPSLRGSIHVKNGDVDGAHYIRRLRDFQLAADFDGNDLVISEFRGRSINGEFNGGGHIAFSGIEPKFYDLHLDIPTAKGIEVTVPELAIPESPLAKKLHFLTTASQCDVKGHVTFHGPAEAPVFFGQAYLSNGHFTFPPSTKNPPPPGFFEWIRRISWDVDLHFSDGAWFENELVEASLNGSMRIKGPSDRLKVDGGIDIGEGQISYLGIEFDIRQARYDLRSDDNGSTIVTTPYVRGIAESTVQTVDQVTGQGIDDTITLNIDYAPVNAIKPRLVSSLDPTLPQDKLLARVTQLEVENLTTQERNYLYQQQMVRLIDTSLATPLARNLLKRTGLVDEVRVSRVINPAAPTLFTDPSNPTATQQNTAANLLAGTKYTLAKNLSNRLSLGYGLRFEQILNPDLTNKLDLRSDVEMSYRFLSNLYLRGSFDLPTTTPGALPDRKVTIEPRIRFGWWGNTNRPKPQPATLSIPPQSTKTSN